VNQPGAPIDPGRRFEERDDYGNYEANLRFLRQAGLERHRGPVLEVGSGKGRLLDLLRREGHDVRGVEISEQLIEESRRLYGDLPVQKVSGHELPFADRTFAAVVSFDVFEHIPDSDAHLREVRRVLKTGGLYLLQTPNKWTNVVFETIRWRSFTAFRVDHCSLHSYREITRRFARHQFDTEFFDVPVVTEFFRWKVRRYLGWPGLALLRVVNPDRFPLALRTNFYVKATLVERAEQSQEEAMARNQQRLRPERGAKPPRESERQP
jgi:SAM-dependent methyltransferase